MEAHYDPAYDRSARRDQRTILGTVAAPSLDPRRRRRRPTRSP